MDRCVSTAISRREVIPDASAIVAALVVIGLGTWIGVRIPTLPGVHAGSTVYPSAAMTGAKRRPTAYYDDYSLVVYWNQRVSADNSQMSTKEGGDDA